MSESNIATTPKACTSQLVIRAVLASATESSCGATALTWHRDLGYWGLFLTADPHTDHFYARWDALRIGEKTCRTFLPGGKPLSWGIHSLIAFPEHMARASEDCYSIKCRSLARTGIGEISVPCPRTGLRCIESARTHRARAGALPLRASDTTLRLLARFARPRGPL